MPHWENNNKGTEVRRNIYGMMGLACAYLITVDDASAFEIQYELQWDLRSTHNYAVVFDYLFGGARKFGIHDNSWGSNRKLVGRPS